MLIRKIVIQVSKIDLSPKSSHHIKIPKALCKRWALLDGQKVLLLFGNRQEEVIVDETASLKTPTIEITLELKEKLAIPIEILPIHCLYKQNENTLTLGPIITCLTNQMYHEQNMFGSMTPFFVEMARFAKLHHIFFYVHPLLNWDEQFYGYIWDQESWKHLLLPSPNAVYNRINSRSFEISPKFEKFSNYLQDNLIFYFNHCFLDKWEIHQALASFPEMVPFLPNTILFDDYDSFVDKLTVHNCIFIKPVNGSQGRQILRIEKKDSEYIVYYSSISQETSTIFRSSYILYKRIKERLKMRPFIIQEGIELLHFEENRPLDFRVLCVKEDQNKWKVVSSVARISPKERIVSNLAQGGEQKRPFDVLSVLFDEKLAKQYEKLMGELALEVAQLISESYEGLFGELGIDIALDKEGKLWIIEANSKPSKSDFDETNDRIRPSTKAIINYLAFLSGFPLNENRKRER